jgi:hypothetical protein
MLYRRPLRRPTSLESAVSTKLSIRRCKPTSYRCRAHSHHRCRAHSHHRCRAHSHHRCRKGSTRRHARISKNQRSKVVPAAGLPLPTGAEAAGRLRRCQFKPTPRLLQRLWSKSSRGTVETGPLGLSLDKVLRAKRMLQRYVVPRQLRGFVPRGYTNLGRGLKQRTRSPSIRTLPPSFPHSSFSHRFPNYCYRTYCCYCTYCCCCLRWYRTGTGARFSCGQVVAWRLGADYKRERRYCVESQPPGNACWHEPLARTWNPVSDSPSHGANTTVPPQRAASCGWVVHGLLCLSDIHSIAHQNPNN